MKLPMTSFNGSSGSRYVTKVNLFSDSFKVFQWNHQKDDNPTNSPTEYSYTTIPLPLYTPTEHSYRKNPQNIHKERSYRMII